MSFGKTLFTTGTLVPVAPGDGAIIGEEANSDRVAMVLSAGVYLTTGDLTTTESGDAGALTSFTVEAWVEPGSVSPGSTQKLVQGPGANVASPVRQYELSMTSTGAISFLFRHITTPYTATTLSPLPDTGWHHIVGVYTAFSATNQLFVYVNGQLAAATTASGTAASDLVTGAADFRVGESTTSIAIAFDAIAFYRIGLSADRILAHYQAGRERGFSSQTSGARCQSVLQTIGSPVARSLDTGQRTMSPRYMQGQAPLDELRSARMAEAGDAVLFIGRDGAVTFLDSTHRASSPYDTVQATFDDDGTDLPYEAVVVDYSESFLANEWNVTRRGFQAETQTTSDATSISRYYKRPQFLSDVPVTTDGDASDIADEMLVKYKEPMTRITSITLSTKDPDVTEAVFRRDIGDRIRVFRTPPGGGTRIDQTLFIQSIQVEAPPGKNVPWRITWGVSPV